MVLKISELKESLDEATQCILGTLYHSDNNILFMMEMPKYFSLMMYLVLELTHFRTN